MSCLTLRTTSTGIKTLGVLATLALFATTDAGAQRPSPNVRDASVGDASVSNANVSNEVLDRRLKSLYRQIRCPVCPAQPISESEAPLSRILREELRTQIVSGKSEKEALSWLVERYGEGVLLKPRFETAAPLWLAPVLCLLVVLGVLRAYLRRRAHFRQSLR